MYAIDCMQYQNRNDSIHIEKENFTMAKKARSFHTVGQGLQNLWQQMTIYLYHKETIN